MNLRNYRISFNSSEIVIVHYSAVLTNNVNLGWRASRKRRP